MRQAVNNTDICKKTEDSHWRSQTQIKLKKNLLFLKIAGEKEYTLTCKNNGNKVAWTRL